MKLICWKDFVEEDIIEKILDFNKRYQEGRGLKILSTDQMLGRLPISLAKISKNSKMRPDSYYILLIVQKN